MSDINTRTTQARRTDDDLDLTDMRTRPAPTPRPRHEAEETRRSFKTTEFYAMVVAIGGILIAGYVNSSGLDERSAWQLATLVAIAYIISRGLAKIGSQSDRDDYR